MKEVFHLNLITHFYEGELYQDEKFNLHHYSDLQKENLDSEFENKSIVEMLL